MAAYAGQHIASLSGDVGRQMDLAADIFREGLDNGCRCLYVVGWNSPDTLLDGFRARGLSVDAPLATGQLIVRTPEQAYLAGGRFDPDRMLDFWRGAIEALPREGFAGLCASGEVAWLGQGAPGAERWLEYDARLNELDFAGGRLVIDCQFRPENLPAWLCRELEKVHPFIQRDNGVVANRAYVECADYLPDAPLVQELEPPADTLPCEWVHELISGDLDGEVSPRRRQEIGRHLQACLECREVAEGLGQVRQALRTLRRPAPPPPDLWPSFQERLKHG